MVFYRIVSTYFLILSSFPFVNGHNVLTTINFADLDLLEREDQVTLHGKHAQRGSQNNIKKTKSATMKA